jgi:hypothetical protein
MTVRISERRSEQLDKEHISQENNLEATDEIEKVLEVSQVDSETTPFESGEDKEE